MSNKCEWRGKPGAEENCSRLKQDGSIYCPRHTFLYNTAKQQRADKESNKLEAQRAGVTGGKLPSTKRQMQERGYEFCGQGYCSGCAALIEWWKTPKGHRAPFDPMPLDASFSRSHFATCPKRAEFKRAS